MRAHRAVAAALLAAACGGIDPGTPEASPPAGAAPGAASPPAGSQVGGSISVAAPGAGAPWVDPEPAEAQAIAEQNAGAPWNANKTTSLSSSMTTLKWDTTTGLVGRRTNVAAATTTLDERLSKLNATTTGTEITIRLPGSVLFDFDSDRIRPDAERTLAEVAEVMKAYAARPMRVEGHTDSIASDEYNQKLSERRAQSVQKWLAASGGVKGAVTPRGFGESKPVAGNETAAGRQLNRRVEIVIEKGG
jgi:outer membrane protein OmpA-like peptidoglycan-associated protein